MAVGALDETGQEKQGSSTSGVKRNYLGCDGRVANGINTVHLSYAREKAGHALVDARQWIPAEAIADPVKSLVTGLPPDLRCRAEGQLVQDQLGRPCGRAAERQMSREMSGRLVPIKASRRARPPLAPAAPRPARRRGDGWPGGNDVVAGDRRHVGNLLFLEESAERAVVAVGLVGGDPAERDPGRDCPLDHQLEELRGFVANAVPSRTSAASSLPWSPVKDRACRAVGRSARGPWAQRRRGRRRAGSS
jgi:hypothetical protein